MLGTDAETRASKADFSTIYNQATPDDYFQVLRPLDYQIPQQALPVVRGTIDAARAAGAGPHVLDLCCSYGINAALLRHDVTLSQLSEHYSGEREAPAGQETDADRAWFSARRTAGAPDVLGLDAAPRAVEYGRRSGLLTQGWAEDLEANEPSEALRSGLRDVGVISCPGGVGYIGARTFETVLDLIDKPDAVWLVVLVLRVFDYGEIAAALDQRGLVTEQLPGRTFRQRRFADEDEQQAAIHDVTARGLDPAAKEADGWFHADCFISRPASAARDVPLEQLVA